MALFLSDASVDPISQLPFVRHVGTTDYRISERTILEYTPTA